MPFTSSQQQRLDAAQKQLDDAKKAYNDNVLSYNTYATVLAPCYNHSVPDANSAATWFNAFTTGACKRPGILSGSSCKPSDCKDQIDKLNAIIPQLKSTYGQLTTAQANYDKVFAEVTAEAAADPQLQLEQAQIQANAAANKLKWVFWIVVVVVVAVSAFVYFKWIRKAI